ncbi:MAG: 23S rRNA (adenine(2503)-C(2))-methyltransferase RlmN [Nanoarchaeota archaeon]
MLDEIETFFKENKHPDFRFKQLKRAILKENITNFQDITTLSKQLREELKIKFNINYLTLIKKEENNETIKFLFKTLDNNFIESVLMKHIDNRKTLCISSQIFCPLNCKFCATGANKFKRNLTTEEIVWQVLLVNNFLKNQKIKITNIVFMGMGEPFLNYENVIESIEIFNNRSYFNIGTRHIVISTVGITPKIYDFANLNLQAKLAISLHASNNKLRDELMPINKKHNIQEIINATNYYISKTNRKVTFEYLLIKDVNDSINHSKELINIINKIQNKKLIFVNLIIYNPHQYATYKQPLKKQVIQFRNFLLENGIDCNVRKSMGDDISSACGQLSVKM